MKSLISFILLFLFLLVVTGRDLGYKSQGNFRVFKGCHSNRKTSSFSYTFAREPKINTRSQIKVCNTDNILAQGSALSEIRTDEVSSVYTADNKITNLVDVKHIHNIQKRGIGGIIAMLTLTTFQIASSGFQLWTAVAEGCNIYPSICTDRDEIQRLEGLIKTLGDEYDVLYYANQWKFLNLRQAMINNRYIVRYLNEAVRAVETIGEIIDIISTQLELDLQRMNQMYANGTDGTLADLVGPFDFALAKIQKMIEDLKNSQIVGLVIQRAVEMFLEKSINYVTKVVSKAKVSRFDASTDSVISRLSSDNLDLPKDQRSYCAKTKNYFSTKGEKIGFAFKAVGNDIIKKFGTSLPNNVKRWSTAAKKWSTFKAKFAESFFGEKSTIGKITKFFKDPKGNIKYKVDNFKFSKGQAFLQAITLIVDGIQIAMDTKAWASIRDSLKDARSKYETYYAQVKGAIAEVKNETIVLNNHWDETMQGFTGLVDQFMNVTNMANENTVFKDVIGLSGHPVDTSDPFFHTDYVVTNETELKGKQDIVIAFFKASDESIQIVQDKFRVQEILISQTKYQINTTQTVDFIFDFIKRIYSSFKDSPTFLSYSSKLTKKDVVCSTAMLLPDMSTYDFYPLAVFRDGKCNVTDGAFATMETNAANSRDKIYLIKAVTHNVPLKTEPSTILSITKALYHGSNVQRIKNYGAVLTEKDVVCQIATDFTNLNSYQLYDLTQFRPDCSKVEDGAFAQMKAGVTNVQNAKRMINFSMQFCDINSASCHCPSVLALMTQLTEAQINVLIYEYKQENKPNCNYVETNGVCKWVCA